MDAGLGFMGFAGDGDAVALPRPALQKGLARARRQAGALALQHRRIFFFSARFGAGWAGYPQPGFGIVFLQSCPEAKVKAGSES